jgi:ketosteroid isomerase-like protein
MKIKILFLFMLIKTSVSFGQSELDKLVDAWHLAASNASFDSYFEVVTDDFVFLGTAPGERWTKDQFAAFSKPYFDKGKAWDFKASNRNWNYSSNGKTAWFDEDLDTWMRGCRGSGVLVKKKGKWKIAYYNLTVLIENEKMKSFIELRDATLD